MANITSGWFDIEDGVTAASAATMQPVLDAVRAICDKANRGSAVLDADSIGTILAAALWYSSSGTGGSDGNGGQPPLAKAARATTSTVASGTYDFSLPSTAVLYWFFAGISGNAVGTYWCECQVMQAYDGSVKILRQSDGSGLSITLSGTSIRVTRAAGGGTVNMYTVLLPLVNTT